jgi:Predicted nucleotide-binding protein containing TIR-like domain
MLEIDISCCRNKFGFGYPHQFFQRKRLENVLLFSAHVDGETEYFSIIALQEGIMKPKFRVYVSSPVKENLSSQQLLILQGILEQIIQVGYLPLNLDGNYYPDRFLHERSLSVDVSLKGMDVLMKECQGAIVLAFAQSRIVDQFGKTLGFSPTEYNHFEGALAIAQGIPLLILAEQGVVHRGITWTGGGRRIITVPQGAHGNWLTTTQFQAPFSLWRKDVELCRDVFLGYCSDAKSLARLVRSFLEEKGIRVLDWRKDFKPGDTILEQIEKAAKLCTCGIFLFTNDDTLTKGIQGGGPKGDTGTVRPLTNDDTLTKDFEGYTVPRDNVIFETGYFVRARGKERTLIIREGSTKLPDDIEGVIYLSLPNRSDISPIEKGLEDFIQERIV